MLSSSGLVLVLLIGTLCKFSLMSYDTSLSRDISIMTRGQIDLREDLADFATCFWSSLGNLSSDGHWNYFSKGQICDTI